MVALSDTVITQAQSAVRALERETHVCAAFVFGSQVTGHLHEGSDIDVAAFIEGAESWDWTRRIHTIARAQMASGDSVELHVFPARALEHPLRGSFSEYVIKHGVRLPLPEAEAAIP